MGSVRDVEIPFEAIDEELIEELIEEFLDSVFSFESHMKREDFIENVSTQAPWVLNSKDLRTKVKQKLKINYETNQLSASSVKWIEIVPTTPQNKVKPFGL